MTSYGAIFFNPSLFFINERPMKFYLDGYANHEINEIAKIIEAFGGKLSAPDVNTIIFSEPGRPITTEYSRYHIQCLHDSMVARKFQDLEQYRIPVIKEELMDPSDHEASHPAGTCVAVVNPNINLLKPWKIVSVSSYAEMAKEKNTREFIQSMSDWHLHSSITNTASESAVFNNNEGENREFTSYSTKRLTFSSSPRGNCMEEIESKPSKRKRDVNNYFSDCSSEENHLPTKKRRSTCGKYVNMEVEGILQ